jgi:hypothetical protein
MARLYLGERAKRMSVVLKKEQIPEHLREFFELVGGGNGVRGKNTHPT